MKVGLCSHLGSNQGPSDYESDALTNWAIGAKNEAQKYTLAGNIQIICFLSVYGGLEGICHVLKGIKVTPLRHPTSKI